MCSQHALLLGVAIFSAGIGALLATLSNIIRHELAQSNFDYHSKKMGSLKKPAGKAGSGAA
jgi:hypothetical protein